MLPETLPPETAADVVTEEGFGFGKTVANDCEAGADNCIPLKLVFAVIEKVGAFLYYIYEESETLYAHQIEFAISLNTGAISN